IIARVMVEMFITGIIILLFLFVGFVFQYELKPENLVLVAAGYVWLVVFSFAVGLVVGIGNTFYVSIGKFIGLFSFILLIFSAVFYPMESIPPEAQEILLYNPLVHFMEMIHGAYLYELDDHFVDYIYMLKWTITPLFIGMWLYMRLEKRIISE
ncbi:MAG: ABC transporter permease, partial [Candidatus Thermoplasmatota archaeon]|nr:ABC transporter permease [Candidatus Thermoplasmatota archaeon]